MKRIILTGILAMAAGIACLAGQAQSGKAPAQPQPKSQAELKAIQAMMQAQDPDSIIKAAEDLLTGFADTQFKDVALEQEAEAYRSKVPPDPIKAQIFAERALEANPANFQANLAVAEIIIQNTPDRALDRMPHRAPPVKRTLTTRCPSAPTGSSGCSAREAWGWSIWPSASTPDPHPPNRPRSP